MAKYHCISHAAARELILSQRINGRGQVFGVAFRRRTTSKDQRRAKGSQEVLYCRFGVRKGLKNGVWRQGDDGRLRRLPAAYDRARHNLFCAYVMNRQGAAERGGEKAVYRAIPFDGIRWLKLDGIVYKVGAPPPAQH